MEIFGGSKIAAIRLRLAQKIGNRESSMRGSRIRGPFGLKKIGYIGKLQKTGKTVHKKIILLTPKLLLLIYNDNTRKQLLGDTVNIVSARTGRNAGCVGAPGAAHGAAEREARPFRAARGQKTPRLKVAVSVVVYFGVFRYILVYFGTSKYI